MSARDRLFSWVDQHPSRSAWSCGGELADFGAWGDRASRYAAGIARLGLRPGQRAAVLCDSGSALLCALLGHYHAGLVHVPINTRYGDTEVAHILADSGAAIAVADTAERLAQIERLRPAHLTHIVDARPKASGPLSFEALCQSAPRARAARRDDDHALFIYTSGTTGRSKGVALSYGAIVAGIGALTDLWRWTPEDRLALALPLFHVHGLCIGVHGALLCGTELEVHERFEAERVAEAIERGATIFMGVPTMYARLIRAARASKEVRAQLRSARLYTCGSAALSVAHFEAFERLTGHKILERYGMSETLITISNPYPPAERRAGTIGRPIPGCEARVVAESGELAEPGEVGELRVRGPMLMTEYWNEPEKTALAFDEGGWFRTGDAVSIDRDGYLRHVGRMSVDILKVGGFKIATREIEEALVTHPEVAEAAVWGEPDEEWGERIEAAVVAAPGAPERSDQAWRATLAEHLDGRIARYKVPRSVRAIEELPRNALGKIQKHKLRASRQD